MSTVSVLKWAVFGCCISAIANGEMIIEYFEIANSVSSLECRLRIWLLFFIQISSISLLYHYLTYSLFVFWLCVCFGVFFNNKKKNIHTSGIWIDEIRRLKVDWNVPTDYHRLVAKLITKVQHSRHHFHQFIAHRFITNEMRAKEVFPFHCSLKCFSIIVLFVSGNVPMTLIQNLSQRRCLPPKNFRNSFFLKHCHWRYLARHTALQQKG